jgi:hypothetical protein
MYAINSLHDSSNDDAAKRLTLKMTQEKEGTSAQED